MAGERAALSAPMPPRLPERVVLPSGLVVRLSDAAARRAASADVADREPCIREIEVLAAEGVLRSESGEPCDPWDLALRDVNVLRALILKSRVLEEPEAELVCDNCEEPLTAVPCELLETGPFVDGELDDPELDAPFDFEATHPIPRVRLAGPGPERWARSVRLAPRTAREARPLLEAAGAEELVVTPAIVRAMGVVALGRERRVWAIADALGRATDEAWSAIVELYLSAHYSARLFAVVRCPACGARNDVDAPFVRELAPSAGHAGAPAPGAPSGLLDLDAFERRVRAIAAEVYRRRRVRNVDLFIDAGVPACDDGGEPLLGSYTPGFVDEAGIAHRPEVRVYYRTFASELERGDFDVDAEIRETIDHEIEHHLHYLSGTDPLDEEEHAQIDRERIALVGRRETTRRAARGFAGEIVGFLRVAWPMLVVAFLATALAWCAD